MPDAQHTAAAHSRGRGACYILLGALCYSTTGAAQAFAPAGVSPYALGAAGMLCAALVLLAWCLWRRRLPRDLGHWPWQWAVPAALGLVGFQLCFFKGVLLAGVAVGTVVAMGFFPIMAAVLAWLVLAEKPSRRWYPATALALAGLVCLNIQGQSAARWDVLLLPLAAGASYACYFVCGKPLTSRYAPDAVMAVLCSLSGVALLPVLFLFPMDWLIQPAGLAVVLFLGLVSTALALGFTAAGLASVSAATAATLALAEPLGAVCWGIFLLDESVGLTQITGIALLVGGVALLSIRND